MKPQRIRNIIVPIDFSKLSIQTIATAENLARPFGATIHLVHVYEHFYPAAFMTPGAPVSISTLSIQEDAAQRLTQLKALATRYGLTNAVCHVLEGVPPFDQICRLAQKLSADLIMTSTHGYTGLKHVVLGSTSERIVQHSPCPVLVVRPGLGSPQRKSANFSVGRILAPVDFSTSSMEGANYAARLAAGFAARLTFLYVSPLGPAYTADGFAMYDLTPVTDAVRREAEDEMRKFVRKLQPGGVKSETAVTIGLLPQEICRQAEDRKIDLIIMSTHGRSGLRHVVLGSVAEYVVRHAPCSVLVVPAHFRARANVAIGSRFRLRSSGGATARNQRKGMLKERRVSRKNRKMLAHRPSERRQTNKYRQSHLIAGSQ